MVERNKCKKEVGYRIIQIALKNQKTERAFLGTIKQPW